MRIALDSNVLLYWLALARTSEDYGKVDIAQRLIPTLSSRYELLVPGQVIGEAYNVLTKAGQGRETTRSRLAQILNAYEIVVPSASTYSAALDLAATHKLQVWDALILSIAVEADCDLLLSEDMQDGFTTSGLTVVDPFATASHPRLAALLA